MGSHPASLPLPTSHFSDDYDDTDDDDPFNPQVQTVVGGGRLGCLTLRLRGGGLGPGILGVREGEMSIGLMGLREEWGLGSFWEEG